MLYKNQNNLIKLYHKLILLVILLYNLEPTYTLNHKENDKELVSIFSGIMSKFDINNSDALLEVIKEDKTTEIFQRIKNIYYSSITYKYCNIPFIINNVFKNLHSVYHKLVLVNNQIKPINYKTTKYNSKCINIVRELLDKNKFSEIPQVIQSDLDEILSYHNSFYFEFSSLVNDFKKSNTKVLSNYIDNYLNFLIKDLTTEPKDQRSDFRTFWLKVKLNDKEMEFLQKNKIFYLSNLKDIFLYLIKIQNISTLKINEQIKVLSYLKNYFIDNKDPRNQLKFLVYQIISFYTQIFKIIQYSNNLSNIAGCFQTKFHIKLLTILNRLEDKLNYFLDISANFEDIDQYVNPIYFSCINTSAFIINNHNSYTSMYNIKRLLLYYKIYNMMENKMIK